MIRLKLKYRLFFLFGLMQLHFTSAFAQHDLSRRMIDSMQNIIEHATQDTVRLYNMLKMADLMMETEEEKVLEISRQVLNIVEQKLPNAIGIEKKRYQQAYIYANNNYGYIYKIKGNYKKASEHYFQCIDMCEQIKDDVMLSQIASNLGALFKSSGEPEKSLTYFKLALEAANRANFNATKGYLNSSIGSYYSNKRDTASAFKYFETALKIHQANNDHSGLGTVYNNLGFMYTKVKNFKKSLHFYHRAMVYKQFDKGISKGQTLNNLSRSHFYLGYIDSAFYYLKRAEEFNKVSNYPEIAYTIEQLYWLIYSKQGKYKEALDHYQKYTTLNDSLHNSGIREQLTKADLKHEFEKKEMLMKSEQDKKDAVAEAENKKQKIISLSIGAALILSLVFFIIVYKNYKEKKQLSAELANTNQEILNQKHLVEEKQKEIVDSINYAQKIQKTLLANHEFVNQTIPDSFVLFQPKDIVSGDFYWATKNESRFYLAVCDSTGHGVPGAFMSLLNISFLNEAINEKNIKEPGKVFDFVRQRLIDNISQEGRKDGMDAILLCIHDNGKIEYAGANNSPVSFHEGVMQIYSADKMPVGLGEKNESFNTHTLKLQKGDMLYLYTDGFADQFGGPKGKKFKYKQLNAMLSSISNLDVKTQEKLMESKFKEWKGDLEQVDDVCVLGIRI